MTPEQMEERDVVEFVDDEGNTLLLEVMDYFFYNGEEFAALCDELLRHIRKLHHVQSNQRHR